MDYPSPNGFIPHLTICNIGHFESNRRRFDDLQKQALRHKEHEAIDELQQLKKEREVLYHKKNNVSIAVYSSAQTPLYRMIKS